jgi:predicted Rossmann fold nucleotide-binding protein DprA/Smf involved in DNA uptake
VQSKTDAILAQPAVTGKRIIDDDQVSGLFGIELEDMAVIPPALPKKKGKTAARKKTRSENAAGSRRKKVSAKKKRVGKQRKSSPAQTKTTGHGSATNLVFGCIEESGEEGILIRDLADITGIPAKQLYPVLHRLKKAGYVHSPARGRYCRL